MDMSTDYLEWPIFGVAQAQKEVRLCEALYALSLHHAKHCPAYARILKAYAVLQHGKLECIEDIPFIPVRLFKQHTLASIPDTEVFKVLTSSGTSSQIPSRIILDKITAAAQTKALVRIMQHFLGKKRLPMLIIDHPNVVKDRQHLTARGTGILGFANFGYDHTYALCDDTMQPDVEGILAFIERHLGKPVLLFGFTFVVWQHFYRTLRERIKSPFFEQATLLHGGGWKKLEHLAVDNATFKQSLKEELGIAAVHNFYGMVEQVGSIFVECEYGRLHTPSFAEVLIRDPHSGTVLPPGKEGLIQVLSLLPGSYPGHSLLTEDSGVWIGTDDCPCNRLGRTFQVHGRIAKAELRGCSDTAHPPLSA